MSFLLGYVCINCSATFFSYGLCLWNVHEFKILEANTCNMISTKIHTKYSQLTRCLLQSYVPAWSGFLEQYNWVYHRVS
jgi:hypothetical protein